MHGDFLLVFAFVALCFACIGWTFLKLIVRLVMYAVIFMIIYIILHQGARVSARPIGALTSQEYVA